MQERLKGKKITFCLPMMTKGPVGGHKVVFEFANRLVSEGLNVTLLFNVSGLFRKYHFPKYMRLKIGRRKVKKGPIWFELDERIEKKCTLKFNNRSVADSDFVVATAVGTAKEVSGLDKRYKKLYFIQGYETWDMTPGEVEKTYCLGMKNLVISKWLKEKVDRTSGKNSILIPNALDFTKLGIDVPIEKRNPHIIAMLYHENPGKGSRYCFEIIEKLYTKYDDLQVQMFGIPERPKTLPECVQYTQKADVVQLKKIYNTSAIFISCSINEGFGLTGAESMACGCALVSFANGGVLEYADKTNAYLSPIKDVNKMYENIVYLFENNEQRIKIAKKGYSDIQKRTWEKTMQLFLGALES